MKVYWQYSDRTPNPGDMKVMKDGRKFIRYFRIHSGMYVVSSGKHCYDWFPYDDDAVKHYRERIENGDIRFIEPSRSRGQSIRISFR